MKFEIVSEITNIKTIAVGSAIGELSRLRKFYGKERWRKLKRMGLIRLPNGVLCQAELHWYEAHGIGKKEFKIKRILSR